MNGFLSLIVTLVVVGLLHLSGVFSIAELYMEFGALISVMTIFVFLFSIYLYWYGQQHGQARHLSGNFIHDFWMGTGHSYSSRIAQNARSQARSAPSVRRPLRAKRCLLHESRRNGCVSAHARRCGCVFELT